MVGRFMTGRAELRILIGLVLWVGRRFLSVQAQHIIGQPGPALVRKPADESPKRRMAQIRRSGRVQLRHGQAWRLWLLKVMLANCLDGAYVDILPSHSLMRAVQGTGRKEIPTAFSPHGLTHLGGFLLLATLPHHSLHRRSGLCLSTRRERAPCPALRLAVFPSREKG